MHRLLQRQLSRHLRDAVPPEFDAFVAAVDAAYQQSDEDRAMLERSLDLSSTELLQANGALRAVVQAFPDMFLRVDGDGLIVERTGGHDDDPFDTDLVGRCVSELPLAANKIGAALAAIRDNRKMTSVEFLATQGGTRKHYEARLVPLRAQQVMVIIRNITELRRALDSLASKADELERSNAELQQFAYVASHDLQEPLRTVSSYLQLLQRRYGDKLGDDANEFIDYAVGGAQRMRQLIDDLLSYARVASRGKSRAPTSLSEVLDNALESLQATIADRNAEIVRPALDDPLDGDLILHADARQLEQLYQNLISNALKFNQGAPRVVLSAERVAERWVLGVHDNGIGMKPEYVGKVFEIFKRLHTREEYEGTGIGLAICRKIVERHGGEIWLESVPGRGSSFLFTIGDEVRDDKQDRTRA